MSTTLILEPCLTNNTSDSTTPSLANYRPLRFKMLTSAKYVVTYCTPWQPMRSTKRADLIGPDKFLSWRQLDGCSVTRPFLSLWRVWLARLYNTRYSDLGIWIVYHRSETNRPFRLHSSPKHKVSDTLEQTAGASIWTHWAPLMRTMHAWLWFLEQVFCIQMRWPSLHSYTALIVVSLQLSNWLQSLGAAEGTWDWEGMLPEITSEAIFVPKMPLVRLECMARAISVRHNTRQSSRGVSVTIVDLVRVGPDEVGILYRRH